MEDFSQLKILLVEDNEIANCMAVAILGEIVGEVISVRSGMDAIERFEQDGFDVVFMDLGLPDTDGFTAIETIKELEAMRNPDHDVPIIALTAHGDADIRERAEKVGMVGFLEKPLIKSDVIKVLRLYAGAIFPSFDASTSPEGIKFSSSTLQVASNFRKSENILDNSALTGPDARHAEAIQVLLIGDNDTAQMSTKANFTRLVCDVEMVGTAEEGLEKIKNKHYHLIVTDIGLPKMTGEDMVKAIRVLEQEEDIITPVVAVTASLDHVTHKRYLKAGFNVVLKKPLKVKMARSLLNIFIPTIFEGQKRSDPYCLSRINGD